LKNKKRKSKENSIDKRIFNIEGVRANFKFFRILKDQFLKEEQL